MGDCRLKSVETIIERQQRMPAKGDTHGLFLKGKNSRVWMFRAGWKVSHRYPFLPLRHGLLIDAIALLVFVPEGSNGGETRSPAIYQAIYAFLKDCGLDDLESLNSEIEPRFRLAAG